MTPEQQAAIERVERNLRTLETYPEPFEQLASDLRTLLALAKRAVREPSEEDVEGVARAIAADRWGDEIANDDINGAVDICRDAARAAIMAFQENGE